MAPQVWRSLQTWHLL